MVKFRGLNTSPLVLTFNKDKKFLNIKYNKALDKTMYLMVVLGYSEPPLISERILGKNTGRISWPF